MRLPEYLFAGAEHLLEALVVDQAAVLIVALGAGEDDLEEEFGRGDGFAGGHSELGYEDGEEPDVDLLAGGERNEEVALGFEGSSSRGDIAWIWAVQGAEDIVEAGVEVVDEFQLVFED